MLLSKVVWGKRFQKDKSQLNASLKINCYSDILSFQIYNRIKHKLITTRLHNRHWVEDFYLYIFGLGLNESHYSFSNVWWLMKWGEVPGVVKNKQTNKKHLHNWWSLGAARSWERESEIELVMKIELVSLWSTF